VITHPQFIPLVPGDDGALRGDVASNDQGRCRIDARTPIAAPMRAKELTIRLINARSRKPMTVVVSIASRSWRASAGSSTGVLPRRTIWRGPRTAAAGLAGMIWPMTIQLNRWRNAARRSFAVGADRARCNCSM
jgi:hypothetical protein